MLSELHEDIVNATFTAVLSCPPGGWFREKYPILYGAIEALVANIFLGVTSSHMGGKVADGYFCRIPDGAGPILLEVGTMRDGKWNHLTWAADERPVRVLRVDKALGLALLHARGTEFEHDLLEQVRTELPRLLTLPPPVPQRRV